MGVRLLGPDVNASDAVFMVERSDGGDKGAIRYALAAIKNVGEAAMERLVRERRANGPFKDLFDLAQRLDPHAVNKRQMENLIRAGAFDSLCSNRRQVFNAIEMLLRHASIANDERDSGQMRLFGGDGAGAVEAESLPKIPDWPKMDRLTEEFEATGLYLSGHPLDDFTQTMKRLKVKAHANIVAAGKPGPRRMAGTLLAISEGTSKKGNRYAFLKFMDLSGNFEAVAFSETLAAHRANLVLGKSFFIRAQFDGDNGRFQIRELEPLEIAARTATGLAIVVDSKAPLAALREVLATGRRGQGQVRLITRLEDGGEVEVELREGYTVSPQFLDSVRAVPGILEAREL